MINAEIMLDALDDLRSRYSEPHRHYHTLAHIEDLFEKERDWRAATTEALDCSPTLAWAIWFHDVIYDPRASNNEKDSAAYAGRLLMNADADHTIMFPVIDLVLSTKDYVPYNDSHEASMFLDLDLSILGSSPDDYQHYMNCIRLEYDFVPAEIYYPKRAEILQSFLARPKIFLTKYARWKWEIQARKNIMFELEFNNRRST